MKKIFTSLFIFSMLVLNAQAINFGMYQPEEDYGLIDGWKLNIGRQNKEQGKKLIQPKTEDPEEQERIRKEKERYEARKDQKMDDEYQMFKFMLDDTVAF